MVKRTWQCLLVDSGKGACRPEPQHLWWQHQLTRPEAASSSHHWWSWRRRTHTQSHKTAPPLGPLKRKNSRWRKNSPHSLRKLQLKYNKRTVISGDGHLPEAVFQYSMVLMTEIALSTCKAKVSVSFKYCTSISCFFSSASSPSSSSPFFCGVGGEFWLISEASSSEPEGKTMG